MAGGSLFESLVRGLGGDALDRIGRQIGTDRETAGVASQAGLAALVGALARNAGDRDGATALDGALEKDHDGSVLDDLAGLIGDPARGNGAGILAHVLGGNRGRVEAGLGRATGLEPGAAGSLLETLAPMVMAALGREKRQNGLDAAGIASLLGGERRTIESATADSGQGGLLGSLLDTDGDGDFDVRDATAQGARLLGKLFKG